MNIEIKNCNNIDSARIAVTEGRLNIKYAINGTGKSTVAHAIELSTNGKGLMGLTPYKYLGEDPISEIHTPSVIFSEEIESVAIFNEEYVNQYLFRPNELVENSFEVFIKTPDYDARMANIHALIENIKKTFKENPDLDELISDLTTFISGFGKAQKGYSKTGSIGKGIAKGNKIINVPPVLAEYTPYIQSEKNAAWLTWQSKGEEYLDLSEQCPYCAGKLSSPQKEVVKQVAIEYDSKYVAELQKMVGVFQSLREYFTEDVKAVIDKLALSSTEFSKEQINYLLEIKNQVNILNSHLIDIRSLDFTSLKDVDKVIAELNRQKIDLELLAHINSEYTARKVSLVNGALDSVIEQAGKLQGEVNKQKALIQNTINKYSSEINGFLESAGYKYNVSIVEDTGANTYRLILCSTDTLAPINDVKLHLSYGERNAFALALFMYRVLKENPSLIILDDPISSFDKNKKYAIMEMLFQGNGSLQGKTVIMLTHDFDPIVDMIHTSSIRCRFYPVPVASFLCNENGILTEQEILPADIQSFFEIANTNIRSDIDIINKLIYLRRRLEACGDKGLAWQLLSNFVHPDRETPVIQDASEPRNMTAEEIAAASRQICEDIPDFDYPTAYARAHDPHQMIELYKTLTNSYEKIQLYRMINHGQISDTVFKKFVDEAFHIENDSLFQLNPSKYSTIPYYIIELCDNGIRILEEQLHGD